MSDTSLSLRRCHSGGNLRPAFSPKLGWQLEEGSRDTRGVLGELAVSNGVACDPCPGIVRVAAAAGLRLRILANSAAR